MGLEGALSWFPVDLPFRRPGRQVWPGGDGKAPPTEWFGSRSKTV